MSATAQLPLAFHIVCSEVRPMDTDDVPTRLQIIPAPVQVGTLKAREAVPRSRAQRVLTWMSALMDRITVTQMPRVWTRQVDTDATAPWALMAMDIVDSPSEVAFLRTRTGRAMTCRLQRDAWTLTNARVHRLIRAMRAAT
jgi:hypothetical protein